MSYSITLRCGCSVYVSCDPKTHVAHTRVIETRGGDCRERRHELGVRLSEQQAIASICHEPPPGPIVAPSETT